MKEQIALMIKAWKNVTKTLLEEVGEPLFNIIIAAVVIVPVTLLINYWMTGAGNVEAALFTVISIYTTYYFAPNSKADFKATFAPVFVAIFCYLVYVLITV